jgi:hypothetical protein
MEGMDSMDDLDDLMDNFDIKTFWRKKQLTHILAYYGIYVAVGTIFMVKKVLDASDAGAVPKGINIKSDSKKFIIR